jgi:RimJ/RimL family protein N-acetyltransferase
MANYFPPDQPVSAGFQSSHLLLEPLRPEHVALDFAAVIESREQLRLWSGSSWPAGGFTLDDNLKDLQWHWREHQERVAFTYTVLDPTRETCLGCVYLRPLAELTAANPKQLTNVAADETVVRFWIRSSRLNSGLEQELLDTLMRWLGDDWPFSRVLYESRDENARQIQLLESSPLHRVMTLQMPGRGGMHQFYAL